MRGMPKPTYEQLETLARLALDNHNAVARYSETRNAQDQAVAVCAKVNCEKGLVEVFGADKVYGVTDE